MCLQRVALASGAMVAFWTTPTQVLLCPACGDAGLWDWSGCWVTDAEQGAAVSAEGMLCERSAAAGGMARALMISLLQHQLLRQRQAPAGQ